MACRVDIPAGLWHTHGVNMALGEERTMARTGRHIHRSMERSSGRAAVWACAAAGAVFRLVTAYECILGLAPLGEARSTSRRAF